MADPIRQQIMAAVDTRLKTITTANGYKTNAGQHVFDWIDRELAENELDAIIYRDKSNKLEKFTVIEYENNIVLEIELKTKEGTDTAKQIRLMIADVYAAFGTDDCFGGLAQDSQPVSEEIDIRQRDKVMGTATLIMSITYETAKWQY